MINRLTHVVKLGCNSPGKFRGARRGGHTRCKAKLKIRLAFFYFVRNNDYCSLHKDINIVIAVAFPIDRIRDYIFANAV